MHYVPGKKMSDAQEHSLPSATAVGKRKRIPVDDENGGATALVGKNGKFLFREANKHWLSEATRRDAEGIPTL